MAVPIVLIASAVQRDEAASLATVFLRHNFGHLQDDVIGHLVRLRRNIVGIPGYQRKATLSPKLSQLYIPWKVLTKASKNLVANLELLSSEGFLSLCVPVVHFPFTGSRVAIGQSSMECVSRLFSFLPVLRLWAQTALASASNLESSMQQPDKGLDIDDLALIAFELNLHALFS